MDKKEILHYRDIFVEEGKRLGSIEERQKIAKNLINEAIDINTISKV